MNGFLQGMSVGQSKSESVAARRAEFERMKREQAEQRIIEEEGHKNAHYLDKEAQEKLGEAGTYKEWTIVYDPQSGENYYYNNFSVPVCGKSPTTSKYQHEAVNQSLQSSYGRRDECKRSFEGKRRMNVLFKEPRRYTSWKNKSTMENMSTVTG